MNFKLAMLTVATALVMGSGLVSTSAGSQTSPQMIVMPNPASVGDDLTIRNESGPDHVCAPPGRVQVQVSDGSGVVASSQTTPDAAGNWRTVVSGGSLGAGTYEVTATCQSDPLGQCTHGGSALACVPCPDGSTATSPDLCPPTILLCDHGGSAPTCVPCPDGSTATSADLCPVPPVADSPVEAIETPLGGVEAARSPVIVLFDYEPVTLEVVGGVVAGTPVSTG